MSGWVPMDASWWPETAAAMSKPWPKSAALFDLRWWSDRVRMGHRRRLPGRPTLQERWGWSDRQVRKLLAAEEWTDRWTSLEGGGQKVASERPESGQKADSERPESQPKTTGEPSRAVSERPESGQKADSERPENVHTRVENTQHPTPVTDTEHTTPPKGPPAGGQADEGKRKRKRRKATQQQLIEQYRLQGSAVHAVLYELAQNADPPYGISQNPNDADLYMVAKVLDQRVKVDGQLVTVEDMQLIVRWAWLSGERAFIPYSQNRPKTLFGFERGMRIHANLAAARAWEASQSAPQPPKRANRDKELALQRRQEAREREQRRQEAQERQAREAEARRAEDEQRAARAAVEREAAMARWRAVVE